MRVACAYVFIWQVIVLKKKLTALIFCLALILCPPWLRGYAYSAECYVLMDFDTAEVICGSNSRRSHSMASTTKIMTALLLCESGGLNRRVTVNKTAVCVEGTSVGLRGGDVLTRENLLYGLILESGNDAANAIAFELGGGIREFAVLMNRRAAEIGMKDTHFVTPSGLDDKQHYTTAYDMGLLCIEAMKNPDFRKAVGTKSYRSVYNGGDTVRTYSNHNRLLRTLSGAEGVKTGFTKKSGRCLVSSCQRNGKRLIAVTLNAPDDWNDHKALYDYGFSLYKEYTLNSGAKLPRIPVIAGNERSLAVSERSVRVMLKSGEDAHIEYKISLPRFVYAPVLCSAKVGEVRYFIGSKTVAVSDIVTDSAVKVQSPQEPTFADKLIGWLKILISVA